MPNRCLLVMALVAEVNILKTSMPDEECLVVLLVISCFSIISSLPITLVFSTRVKQLLAIETIMRMQIMELRVRERIAALGIFDESSM